MSEFPRAPRVDDAARIRERLENVERLSDQVEQAHLQQPRAAALERLAEQIASGEALAWQSGDFLTPGEVVRLQAALERRDAPESQRPRQSAVRGVADAFLLTRRVHRVRGQCPRCGCVQTSVEVIAWADFMGGDYQVIDLTKYIEVKPDGVTICRCCGHEWPTEICAPAEPQRPPQLPGPYWRDPDRSDRA